MSTTTEQRLRELFAADAAAAPADVELTVGTLQKVRRSRRARTAGVMALVATVVAVGAVVETGASGRATQRPPAAASPHPAGQATLPGVGRSSAPAGEGPLRSGIAADCVEAYSPAAVAERSFAFDGTVTAIGPALSNRSGPPMPLVGVTFRVNQWFRGGTGRTATIDMEAPLTGNADSVVQAYGIGTRLLVSGEPRWGGAPLAAAIEWGCGFTRYYDAQTAAEWAAATR
jgi:hypothetical protein